MNEYPNKNAYFCSRIRSAIRDLRYVREYGLAEHSSISALLETIQDIARIEIDEYLGPKPSAGYSYTVSGACLNLESPYAKAFTEMKRRIMTLENHNQDLVKRIIDLEEGDRPPV